MAPAPTTATVSDPVTPARRSACSEHDTGSTSAASATSSPSGSGTRHASGTRSSSAMPPSTPTPSERATASRHWLTSPATHRSHTPHAANGQIATGVPSSR